MVKSKGWHPAIVNGGEGVITAVVAARRSAPSHNTFFFFLWTSMGCMYGEVPSLGNVDIE
jgi:hypothetical protein